MRVRERSPLPAFPAKTTSLLSKTVLRTIPESRENEDLVSHQLRAPCKPQGTKLTSIALSGVSFLIGQT